MIQEKDADGDGALSLAELTDGENGMPEELFSEIDTDGDGLLTQDELAAARPEPPPRPPQFDQETDMASLLESLNQSSGDKSYASLASWFQSEFESSHQ